jgi:ATP-binding protein involved in chromosome partitioning
VVREPTDERPRTSCATAGDEAVAAAVVDALRDVVDPELGEDVVSLGMVREVRVEHGQVEVDVALTVASCPLRGEIAEDARRHVARLAGVRSVQVRTGAMDKAERSALMARARRKAQEKSALSLELGERTRVLAIVSGKGGVGKSSIAVNLAAALAAPGRTIGLLDADVWGFSVPRMLGVSGPLAVRDGKMVPVELAVGAGRIEVVSMGFLSGEDEAIMWRGLVLNRAVQHFLEDVAWQGLDYLLVDMPPGTGDVQMGLARMLPRAELLVVTTPALAAQKVAGRAADMARKGHLKVAGVIENMAGFTCDHGERYLLFGEGGGQRLADELGVPLVGSVPVDPAVAAGGDAGRPAALDGRAPLAQVFSDLAEKVAAEIAPLVTMTSCSARLLEHVEAALKRSAS